MIDFWPTSEGTHVVLIEDCTVRQVGVLWI